MNLFRKVLAALGREAINERDTANIDEMSPEELIRAAENVMACREAINTLLNLVAEHQSDGHECMPYCISSRLNHALLQLDEYQTRMVLTVLLKDVYQAYSSSHSEHHHEM